jgi:hypothetical protein
VQGTEVKKRGGENAAEVQGTEVKKRGGENATEVQGTEVKTRALNPPQNSDKICK